jgi:alpha-glucosidase
MISQPPAATNGPGDSRTEDGLERSGAHLPFNFQLITLPWQADVLAASIAEYEASLPDDAWPTWVLSNHDKRRVASRLGPGQARLAVVLLLTLRGTPTLYYDDEIGMTDTACAVPGVQREDPR